MATVVHPYLRDGVEARAYQLRSLERALTGSSLMVMPTGFGKTAVQWMVMAEHLRTTEDKIILIAPTTGLVDQHVRMARQFLKVDEECIVPYTGETPPKKREAMWHHGRIFMATPQVVRNDATNGSIDLREVALLIVDEAHHATGNHAYAQVGRLYRTQRPDGRILAATASPGSTLRHINEVKTNLNALSVDLSKRTEPLLQPYEVDMVIHQHRLPLPPELMDLTAPIDEHVRQEIAHLQRLGFLAPKEHISSGDIERAQLRASRAIQQRDVRGYDAARRVADLRRLHMIQNLMRSQGSKVVQAFLDRAEIEGREGRNTNRMLALPVVHSLRLALNDLDELHPKTSETHRLVERSLHERPEGKILVFTEYRDTVQHLVHLLNGIDAVRADAFIGQSSRGQQKGMTQRQQLEQLRRFREGEINVLVATSVGEEGLDVPAADLVVLYEPVPSAVRAIQRRGRTARQRAGSVHVLIAEGSRDVFVQRASENQEANMHRLLAKMVARKDLFQLSEADPRALDAFSVLVDRASTPAKRYLEEAQAEARTTEKESSSGTHHNTQAAPRSTGPVTAAPLSAQERRPRSQTGLERFFRSDEPVEAPSYEAMKPVLNAAAREVDAMSTLAGATRTVWVDHREANSTLPSLLKGLELDVRFTHLPKGDVRLSSRVLIERKSARDLLTSIKDGRLLHQCRSLAACSSRPLLLVEHGEGGHGLHPNAVLGALAHITLELGLPVMMTKGPTETAHFIAVAAQQEHRWLDEWCQLVHQQTPSSTAIEDAAQTAQATIDALMNETEGGHPWLTEAVPLLHQWFTSCLSEAGFNADEVHALRIASPHLASVVTMTVETLVETLGCSTERARELVAGWVR